MKYFVKANNVVDAIKVVNRLKNAKANDAVKDAVTNDFLRKVEKVLNKLSKEDLYYLEFEPTFDPGEEAYREFSKYSLVRDVLSEFSNMSKSDVLKKLRDIDISENVLRSLSDSICDATPHEVVVYTNNILREMGLNNSIGKYDRIVRALRDWYGQGFLTGDELKARIRQEIPRLLKRFGLEDSIDDNDDIKFLSKEEKQAIDDYKKAIANTKDPKLLRLFSHILREEIEHLEELENEELGDSNETTDAEDTYYKVRYGHEGDEIQYTSVLIVKGSSEQDVIRKFKSKKPGYKIFSVTEGVPEGVESMRRRGMSVWDN